MHADRRVSPRHAPCRAHSGFPTLLGAPPAAMPGRREARPCAGRGARQGCGGLSPRPLALLLRAFHLLEDGAASLRRAHTDPFGAPRRPRTGRRPRSPPRGRPVGAAPERPRPSASELPPPPRAGSGPSRAPHGTRSGHNAAGRDASRCPARDPPSPSPGAHPSPRGRGPSSPRSLRRSPREAAAARSLVPPGRAGDGRRAEGGRAGPGARPRRACAGLSCPLAGKGSGAAPPYSRRPAAPPRPARLRPRPAPETPGRGTLPVTPPSRAVPVGGEGSRKIPPPRHGAQQAAPAPSAVLCLRSVLSLSGSCR